MQPFRLIAALAIWAGLALQYAVVMRAPIDAAPLLRTFYFFCYFTIQINILAGLSMTLPALAPASSWGRFFARPAVRVGIATYLVIGCAIYYLLVRHVLPPQVRHVAADVTLHYVVPALCVIDWLMFVRKGMLRLRDVALWLAFPTAYGVFTQTHGAISGFYPYPFVDAGVLGYGPAIVNSIALGAMFILVGLAWVGIDRVLARRMPRRR